MSATFGKRTRADKSGAAREKQENSGWCPPPGGHRVPAYWCTAVGYSAMQCPPAMPWFTQQTLPRWGSNDAVQADDVRVDRTSLQQLQLSLDVAVLEIERRKKREKKKGGYSKT